MMTIDDWAVKIAEAVSPEEAELAPVWVRAFVKGGRDRRDLFIQTNAQASGFLPGELMQTMPPSFASAATLLLAILASENTGKFLEAVRNALSIPGVFRKGKGWFSSDFARTRDTSSQAFIYARLNEVMSRLDKEIESLGLDEPKRDRISLTVLRLLLENQMDAPAFLHKLTEKK